MSDEPITALNVTTQIEVLAAMEEVIKLLNTTAIYNSHELTLVVQLPNRIIVLRSGNVVHEGSE